MESSDKEEYEDYIRLNILIPKDTLAKLDYMKTYAGFGSRGRTIQALVEKVWDSQRHVKLALAHYKIVKSQSNPTMLDLMPMMIELIDIMNMIRTFVKIED